MKIHEKYVAQRRSHSIWHRPIRPIYFHAWNKLWLFIPDVRKLCSCCAHAPVHIFNVRGHFATDYVVLLHFRVARASHRLTVLAGNVFRIVFYSLRCYVLRSWTPHLVELLFLWLLLFTIEVGNSKLFFFFFFLLFFCSFCVTASVGQPHTHATTCNPLLSGPLSLNLWHFRYFQWNFDEINRHFFFRCCYYLLFSSVEFLLRHKNSLCRLLSAFKRDNHFMTLWMCLYILPVEFFPFFSSILFFSASLVFRFTL